MKFIKPFRYRRILNSRPSFGFTLIEMILVIVITGILGGMVAVFIKAPVQGYLDSARRAEMTDIADTSLRRIERDLRTALPNSVRVTVNGSTSYLEYLETIAGGRYNTTTTPVDCLNSGGCTALTTTGDLVTGTAGTASTTLLNGKSITLNSSRLVVYNQYNNSGGNCSSENPSVYCASSGNGSAPVITAVSNGASDPTADVITFASTTFLPAGGSPNNRYQIISQPVTYACTPGGTLTRYWGYAMQPTQPFNSSAAPLATANSAILATNVGATCFFKYDTFALAQQYGLVTMELTISELNNSSGTNESVSLYSSTHVSNIP